MSIVYVVNIFPGSRKFSLRSTVDSSRVLRVDSGRKRHGTVVEEGHLQGDSTTGRQHPRVLQVTQLDGETNRWMIDCFCCLGTATGTEQ